MTFRLKHDLNHKLASPLSSESVPLLTGSNKSLKVKGALAHRGAFYQMQRMHSLHVHGVCTQAPCTHYPPHMRLPTVFLADLTAPTAAPKLKYSSLIRCLQHMIYFDSPLPAVENIHC